jgi:hypothetical protein
MDGIVFLIILAKKCRSVRNYVFSISCIKLCCTVILYSLVIDISILFGFSTRDSLRIVLGGT